MPQASAPDSRLGLYLMNKGRYLEATDAFTRALETEGENTVTLNNLARCFQMREELALALIYYLKAWRHEPTNVSVCLNIAGLLQSAGRADEAAMFTYKALRNDPTRADVIGALLPQTLNQLDWSGLEPAAALLKWCCLMQIKSGWYVTSPAFLFNALGFDERFKRLVASSWSRRSEAEAKPAWGISPGWPHPHRGERIKVCYVSPDFRLHSLGSALRGIIANHDREKFEVHVFHTRETNLHDSISQWYIRTLEEGNYWDVSKGSLTDIAEGISRLGIHVMVDLCGHTKGSLLGIFAQRPAPVRVHYLGYGTTTGADYMDYLLTDKHQYHSDELTLTSEKLAWLPDTFMSTDLYPEQAYYDRFPVTRESEGLPSGAFVFCNFNNRYKQHPLMMAAWARILKACPDSVLWLYCQSYPATKNALAFFESRGIKRNRLVFADKSIHGHHMKRLLFADVMLDCLYHQGGVTTADALWMGLPVVTINGATPSARTGASLLLGGLRRPELVAKDLGEYEAIAETLYRDLKFFQHVKKLGTTDLAQTPLFDHKRLARHVESAYDHMLKVWDARQKPKHFEVPE